MDVLKTVEDYKRNETDDEVIVRLNDTFRDLSLLTHGVMQGYFRSLFVVGDSGMGKTYTAKTAMERYSNGDGSNPHTIIGGKISAINLYRELYRHSAKGQVLVLDDVEFDNKDAINLVKHVLDTSEVREVSWSTQSTTLKRENIPNKFQFEGGVIFLTNTQLLEHSGSKLDHFKALVSRSHYVNLQISSTRERILRIKSLSGSMFGKYNLSDSEVADIITFLDERQDLFIELSLRMGIKLAELLCAFPDTWKELAISSCMVPEARFIIAQEKKNLTPKPLRGKVEV